jgi:secondary thiamine-phosphate synthase enzyme
LRIISKTIKVSSNSRNDLVNITSKIRETIRNEHFKSGLVNVFVKHTTCGIIVNEAEAGLIEDIKNHLIKMVPYKAGYKHDNIDSNADAHIKSIIVNPSLTIPIANNDLILGTWQSLFLYELDGPRNRSLQLTFIVE